MGNQCTRAPKEHYWDVNVRRWTSAHVYAWLSTVDNGELKSAAIILKKHKVNGNDLISISKNNKRLRSMRIAIGDRLLISRSVKTLLLDIDDNLYTIPLKGAQKSANKCNTKKYNHINNGQSYNINVYNIDSCNYYNYKPSIVENDDISSNTGAGTRYLDGDVICTPDSLSYNNYGYEYGAFTRNPPCATIMSPNNAPNSDANHATIRCNEECISDADYNCVSTDYNTTTINRDLDDAKSDIEYSQTYHDDVCYEDHEEKIKELSTAHTATLYMLQTAKEYLVCGYLRNRSQDIPQSIIALILSFFDESCMDFNIKVADLLTHNNKLQSRASTFQLSMDHKIKLLPTLTRTFVRGDNLNVIELALECQELSTEIDHCLLLIHMFCQCDGIKYHKMDICMFGTDLMGYNMCYNLLNTPGLKMVFPQKDIENLNKLQFKINATVLQIEYDPKCDHYGIVPTYNKSLKMNENISHKWQLNQRIICILAKDKFKQKFYSNHFNYEHFCLSSYKNAGELILLLKLLRLEADISSIDCRTCIEIIKNEKQIVWSQHINVHMDMKYNNSFKWKLNPNQTNKLFINAHDNNSTNLCIHININVVKVNAKKLQTSLDIYNHINMMDMG